jgi:hypothetical protein
MRDRRLGWCPQLVGWLAGCPHFQAAPQVLQCGPVRLRAGEGDGHRRTQGSRGAGGGPPGNWQEDRRCPPVCCQRYAPCTALLYCPLVLPSCTALVPLYCPHMLYCALALRCPLVMCCRTPCAALVSAAVGSCRRRHGQLPQPLLTQASAMCRTACPLALMWFQASGQTNLKGVA